ncbi:MAG TPA: hypothetical protein VEG08_07030 [Terriglobales bacterium]|nr:hypothetical protein [Terriglobales bacterium]
MANWIATPLGQLVLVVILARRSLIRQMPWFFAYTIWVMTTSLVQLPLYLQSRALRSVTSASFYVSWTADAGSIMLGFLAVYEVFCQVFQPYESFRRWAPALFRWCGVTLLLLGSAGALLSSPHPQLRIVAGLLVLERTLRVVQVGLLVLVLLTSRYLHITWKPHLLGVASGFGMYAAVAIVCTTLQAQNGPVGYWALGMVSFSAYTCAVMIWVAYFLVRQPVVESIRQVPRTVETEQWHQALSHLLQR